MTIAARLATPDYLVRASEQVVRLELYEEGVLVAPTEAGSTFALTTTAGAVVASGAVDVVDDVATYTLSSGDLAATLPLGRGYREVWTLVVAGAPIVFRRDAALVRYAPYPVVTDADLEAVYSDLSRQRASTETSFARYIDEAWKRILGRLERDGVFPDRVVTSYALREVHVELALHLVCLDLHRAAGGRWGELAQSHRQAYELEWGRLRFPLDDETGSASGGGSLRPAAPSVVHLSASPYASWRGL